MRFDGTARPTVPPSPRLRSLAIATRADESAATRWHVAAAFAAWVVPGLGHYLLGQRARGLILGVTIGGLWLAGVLIGGVDALDREDHPAWFLGQMLVAPSVVVSHWYLPTYLEQGGREPRPQVEPDDPPPPYVPSYGRVNEQGVLYTALAGMLNLLAILDVLYRDPTDPRHRHVPAPPRSPSAPPAPAPEAAP